MIMPSPPPVSPGPARPSACTPTSSPSRSLPPSPPPGVESPAEERDAALLSISAEAAEGVAVGGESPCPSWFWSREELLFGFKVSCPWLRKSARTAASGCKKSPCASTTRASTTAGTTARLGSLRTDFAEVKERGYCGCWWPVWLRVTLLLVYCEQLFCLAEERGSESFQWLVQSEKQVAM